MLGAIKHNLSNLTNFEGRDARQTFWFYVLFLVIVQYAIGVVITAPMMGGMMQDAFRGASEGVSEGELHRQMMRTMSGSLRNSIIASIVVSLLAAFCLLASFVRRLHDSGRPGWIAAVAFVLVVASQAAAIANMNTVLDAMMIADPGDPLAMMQAQRPLLMTGAFSWIGYLIVIVFGVWPSTPGPNRYGDEPARF